MALTQVPANMTQFSTPRVALIPTFVGLGTVTGIQIFTWRAGDSLKCQGYFTTGTVTGSTATISFGFNGTNGNVTMDTTKIPLANSIVGSMWVGGSTTSVFSFTVLAVPANTGTLSFGGANGTLISDVAQTGSTLFGSSLKYIINFEIPIVGW